MMIYRRKYLNDFTNFGMLLAMGYPELKLRIIRYDFFLDSSNFGYGWILQSCQGWKSLSCFTFYHKNFSTLSVLTDRCSFMWQVASQAHCAHSRALQGCVEQESCFASCEYFWNFDWAFSSLASGMEEAGLAAVGGGVWPEAAWDAAAAAMAAMAAAADVGTVLGSAPSLAAWAAAAAFMKTLGSGADPSLTKCIFERWWR